MKSRKYIDFLKSKMAIAKDTGFEVSSDKLNSALLPHQKDIVRWAIKGGRRAVFAQFGLGIAVGIVGDGVDASRSQQRWAERR